MKLLVIEMDEASSGWLSDRLKNCGFVPQFAESVEIAMQDGLIQHSHAIIVDLGASSPSGRAIVRPLRYAGFNQPLLILSARSDWREKIACLDAGADDCLVKPVRSDEIAARLRAMIRRCAGNSTDLIVLGDIELDLKARCAWRTGECLNLTRNEFRLLRLFLLEPEHVKSHQEIHSRLYPEDSRFSHNAIEVQIARLRRKVGQKRIRTVRGVGYRYVTGEADGWQPTELADECRARNCELVQNRAEIPVSRTGCGSRERERSGEVRAVPSWLAHI